MNLRVCSRCHPLYGSNRACRSCVWPRGVHVGKLRLCICLLCQAIDGQGYVEGTCRPGATDPPINVRIAFC